MCRVLAAGWRVETQPGRLDPAARHLHRQPLGFPGQRGEHLTALGEDDDVAVARSLSVRRANLPVPVSASPIVTMSRLTSPRASTASS